MLCALRSVLQRKISIKSTNTRRSAFENKCHENGKKIDTTQKVHNDNAVDTLIKYRVFDYHN